MSTFVAVALAVSLGQAPANPAQQPPPQTAPPLSAAGPAPAPAGEVITLAQAMDAAANQNLDLRAVQARLRQSNEASWKAWSGYLPQLAVSGTYVHNQFEDTVVPFAGQELVLAKQDMLSGQADLSQVLISPALWFGIRAASAGEGVASETIAGVRRDVLFGVAQAYYGVSSLKRLAQVSEQLLEIAQRQERDSRVRFQAGTIAKVGLLRAEIDRARAEQDLKRARNSYESARLGLSLLLNRAPDFEIADPPEPALPSNPSELEDAAVRDRSEVKAARANVALARASRNAAIARYFPNIAAFGRYSLSNQTGFTGQEGIWAVGLGAQWQILDGGRRESDIREGNARIDEAEASAASTEQKVRNEVRQALLDLDSARANAAKAKEQRDLAAENQRLVDVSYRAGAATAVEQADATAQLRNAETGYTAESLGSQLAALRVLRAAGAFKPTK